MPIDPKLYQKYTGRAPGIRETRLAESMAESSRASEPDHQEQYGWYFRHRRAGAILFGLAALIAVAYFVLTGR
jgi:hypothetical protein